jgi:hypothetical protein
MKKAVEVKAAPKKYIALEGDEEGGFPESVEGAVEDFEDGDVVVLYEMTELGRFVVSTKPTLTPIK